MQGYWNAANTVEAIDRAGWMHTGDLGMVDEDGYVAVTGRSKDMVIRGGNLPEACRSGNKWARNRRRVRTRLRRRPPPHGAGRRPDRCD
jgi:hypothetical protein